MKYPQNLLPLAGIQAGVIATLIVVNQILFQQTSSSVEIGGELVWMGIGMVAVLYGVVLLLASWADRSRNVWAVILLLVLEAGIALANLENAARALFNPIDFAILGLPVVAALVVAIACGMRLQAVGAKPAKRSRRG